jgi:transposase InsO family protein
VGEGVDVVSKYAFVEACQAEFPITTLCRVVGVSKSGFYEWQARRAADPTEAERAEEELLGCIRVIHARSKGSYGCPRVAAQLAKDGRRVNHKRVERLMRKHGIQGRCGRRRVRTTVRDPQAQPAADLVRRDFTRDELNELWIGDITYIPTDEGWLFMSTVIDACSRRLLGWSLAEHMRAELVADALNAALLARGRRQWCNTLVFHSDHGSQYTSGDYRTLLTGCGIRQSMGTVGDSYDNAMAESFFASLKRELVDWTRFATLAEARAAVFEWVAWYNNHRLHTSLQMQTPTEYETNITTLPLVA